MFFAQLWSVMLALAPWLLLGAALAGVLHVLLPPDFVRRHLHGGAGVWKDPGSGTMVDVCHAAGGSVWD